MLAIAAISSFFSLLFTKGIHC